LRREGEREREEEGVGVCNRKREVETMRITRQGERDT